MAWPSPLPETSVRLYSVSWKHPGLWLFLNGVCVSTQSSTGVIEVLPSMGYPSLTLSFSLLILATFNLFLIFFTPMSSPGRNYILYILYILEGLISICEIELFFEKKKMLDRYLSLEMCWYSILGSMLGGKRLWCSVHEEKWQVESSEPKEFDRSFSERDDCALKVKVIWRKGS